MLQLWLKFMTVSTVGRLLMNVIVCHYIVYHVYSSTFLILQSF